ncbi:MAG: 50S ribosomal protein L32 [Candidatus Caldatribacterium sp.]|uniref:50S ribosomal protein L32 n=1 Tax=Candidatus Caldatribacterium sp. TaxID=2282143 RepID=UPI002992C2CA|nr:50S ribosomal protein L32 [Candidatus Caldatribacterium sp.]MCX7729745.1 50S ribosomal protein L32 [Candidatus Caldatribacterium sp.]MDW8080506.1 50S ribosomal protein L32 [Candidatus Calescibacterium sp.]
MANLTNKTSRCRRNKRRTHWVIHPPHLVSCPHCHTPKLPHHVCPECGYYKGRQVLKVEE